MGRFDFPIAPMILRVILGPLAGAQLRRTLLVSDGDWTALVDRPFALTVLVLALLAVVVPLIVRARGRALPSAADEN